jgi:hypothetical protein
MSSEVKPGFKFEAWGKSWWKVSRVGPESSEIVCVKSGPKVPGYNGPPLFIPGDVQKMSNRHIAISTPIRESRNTTRNLDESHSVRFPTLRKMVETTYVDPRQEGKRIHFQKEGTFAGNDGRIMRGTYVCYHEAAMPSKCVTVFVDEEIREGMAEDYNPVNLISITGDRKAAMSRVSYRNRVAERMQTEQKELEEGRRPDLARYQDVQDLGEAVEEAFGDSALKSASNRDEEVWRKPKGSFERELRRFKKPPKNLYPTVKTETSTTPPGKWTKMDSDSDSWDHSDYGTVEKSYRGYGYVHYPRGEDRTSHDKPFATRQQAMKHAEGKLRK